MSEERTCGCDACLASSKVSGASHWLNVARFDATLADYWWERAFNPQFTSEKDTLEAEEHNRRNARDYMQRGTFAATMYQMEKLAEEKGDA